MDTKIAARTISVFALAAAVVGCRGGEHVHAGADEGVTNAICALAPTAGNRAAGTVRLVASGGEVRVTGNVTGLNPNRQHAFHVHEFGDVSSADGSAAGSHYNPEGHPHGLPVASARHAGDFGNLRADDSGQASIDITVDNISLAGHHNPVVGRAIIVHANEDDGGQPTGNAGARIAQCVIGIAAPAP